MSVAEPDRGRALCGYGPATPHGDQVAAPTRSAVTALGMTAARTGKTVTIIKARGKALSLEEGTELFITVHPSSLLRMKDDNNEGSASRQFVADLKVAAVAASSLSSLQAR
jgi:uracil-DNA glycosylase